jgi:tripartite-type tricarboxylate transporter receptor subunit TctC
VSVPVFPSPQSSTPEQFAAFLQAEYDKWGEIIKNLKISEK